MVQPKKLDSRIHKVIQESVKNGHRGLVVLVGERSRDQVVILHHLLSKANVSARPSVLWCYKHDLGFTTHKKKRLKMIKKKIRAGTLDPNTDDTFEMFISATEIRYMYYSESHNVLGNTYGMCILQDFEAITPNVLARTIETVQGGGLIVIVLNSVSDIKQLYDLQMDCHNRFVTNAYQTVVPRFNKRFLLSLTECSSGIVLSDALEVLPFTAKSATNHVAKNNTAEELANLKTSLSESQPIGSVINICKSLDQANALVKFVDVISEKSLKSVITLTASRGRGKSAALGLAIATSIAFGYSNIFVTSPSPDNLKTLFEFVLKGFDILGFTEHTDYEIIQNTNDNIKSVVRINIYRDHRQTIQYIKPDEGGKLLQAELLVIDEAGAIPLHLVKQMLGPYLVLLSSTVHGYEGTGRSLSLKLFEELRIQSTRVGGTSLTQLKLEEPIRYKEGDPVESWLNKLLCLDASPRIISGCPTPKECSLYFVDKDILFSYHKASESFLQRIMTLYVSSHYKNSPNDLQLLSDAPAHQLLVLLGPIDSNSSQLPEVLCVLQICFEGQINRQIVISQLEQGHRSAGDLIPWTICQQFQDANFGELSGIRIVRIATHPDFQSMGYGKHAMNLLSRYYKGEIATSEKKEGSTLLIGLNERTPEAMDYIGVSYGMTPPLLKFWKRLGFRGLYLRQTPNDITGEHTCIMVQDWEQSWLKEYHKDFTFRLLNLLGYQFRKLPPQTVLNMINTAEVLNTVDATSSTAFSAISKYDFRRLKSYSDNLTDYHIILDLVPTITKLYFQGKMNLNLSPLQATILISLGLQYKTIDETSIIFPDLETNQILGIFKKIIKKTVGYMEGIMKAEIDSEIKDAPSKVVLNGIEGSMRDELNKVESEFKEKQKENAEKVKDLIKADDAEFSIKSNDFGDDVKLTGNTIVSIKRTIVAETPSIEKSGKKKKRKSEGPEKTKKKKKQPIS
ncbi:RNA cytidine acetyltransferase-like [Bolinopsis microptera]|uniref:RNA cytidine acetyltransferase-like n=1 Tax=Bolinopsis microptera TaxID=2820187 RepID=UPI003079D154